MTLKLSICIPTYNFGKFIGETLESIIPQLNELVEVVILDGASTDNTQEIVQQYQQIAPQIRYFRQMEKGGIDRDMHLAVEKAQGGFCWLFSSDDVVVDGAIEKILLEINENCEVYLSNFTICTLDINVKMEEHSILKINGPKKYNLTDELVRKKYFEQAIATPAFFSFMGSLIIKRSRWLETSVEPRFFGSCWAHAARIFRMIPNGLQVKYLDSSLLRKRSFNDSFMDRGFIHRIAIAIDGYLDIAHTIFGESSFETFHIRRALKKEFPLSAFLVGKKEIKSRSDRVRLLSLLKKTYSDDRLKRWFFYMLIGIFPDFLIVFLRKVNRARKIFFGKMMDVKV